MSDLLRKILLPLNGTPNGEAALATALILARRFGAHLGGVARPQRQPRGGPVGR